MTGFWTIVSVVFLMFIAFMVGGGMAIRPTNSSITLLLPECQVKHHWRVTDIKVDNINATVSLTCADSNLVSPR